MNDDMKKESVKGVFKVLVALITILGPITVAWIEHNDAVSLREQVAELQVAQSESQQESISPENNMSSLEKRISELEKANQTLHNEKAELEGNYATAQENYAAALAEIDRLNEELGKPKRPSGSSVNFIEVCSPYDPPNPSYYQTPDTITMLGMDYSNGFTLSAENSGYVLFGFGQEEYDTLEFDFGRVDGSATLNVSYKFYLEGQFLQTVNGTSEAGVQHISIPLNGASQMRIEFRQVRQSTGLVSYSWPIYGFANAILTYK